MTDFYSQNRCVCSTRSHGPLLCAFCLSFHFNYCTEYYVVGLFGRVMSIRVSPPGDKK